MAFWRRIGIMRVDLLDHFTSFCVQHKKSIKVSINILLFISGGGMLAAGGFGAYYVSPAFLTLSGAGVGLIFGSTFPVKRAKARASNVEDEEEVNLSDSETESSISSSTETKRGTIEEVEQEEGEVDVQLQEWIDESNKISSKASEEQDIDVFPDEVILQILQFLNDPLDHLRVAGANRQYYRVAHDPKGQLALYIKGKVEEKREWDLKMGTKMKDVFPKITDIPTMTPNCLWPQLKKYTEDEWFKEFKSHRSPLLKGKVISSSGNSIYYISIGLQYIHFQYKNWGEVKTQQVIVLYCYPNENEWWVKMDFHSDKFITLDKRNTRSEEYFATWLKKLLAHNTCGALPDNLHELFLSGYKELPKEQYGSYRLFPMEDDEPND